MKWYACHVFTLSNHFHRALHSSSTTKYWQVHKSIHIQSFGTMDREQQDTKATAKTVQVLNRTFSSTNNSRVDKHLQQMEVGKEIPPEVWGNIRVHLRLCVDLPLWNMLRKALSLGEKESQERRTNVSAVFLVFFTEMFVVCFASPVPVLKRNKNKQRKVKSL